MWQVKRGQVLSSSVTKNVPLVHKRLGRVCAVGVCGVNSELKVERISEEAPAPISSLPEKSLTLSKVLPSL